MGSEHLKITYKHKNFSISAYLENYYDDFSGMGKQNGLDGLWGIEYKTKRTQGINNIVLEYYQTTNQSGPMHDLASQKHRLWDGFCMNFLQGLYVALWALLLFIPGVVKAYSYAMTPYIMAEHPGLTANEAITESRRIMDGNKWRLFCLDLSFLGWELLCTLPMLIGFSLVFTFTHSADTVLVLLILLSIPLSAGFFFLHPYEEAAWAIFYRDITAAPSDTEEI